MLDSILLFNGNLPAQHQEIFMTPIEFTVAYIFLRALLIKLGVDPEDLPMLSLDW